MVKSRRSKFKVRKSCKNSGSPPIVSRKSTASKRFQHCPLFFTLAKHSCAMAALLTHYLFCVGAHKSVTVKSHRCGLTEQFLLQKPKERGAGMAYLQNNFLHNSKNLVKEFFNKVAGNKNSLSVTSCRGKRTFQILQFLVQQTALLIGKNRSTFVCKLDTVKLVPHCLINNFTKK